MTGSKMSAQMDTLQLIPAHHSLWSLAGQQDDPDWLQGLETGREATMWDYINEEIIEDGSLELTKAASSMKRKYEDLDQDELDVDEIRASKVLRTAFKTYRTFEQLATSAPEIESLALYTFARNFGDGALKPTQRGPRRTPAIERVGAIIDLVELILDSVNTETDGPSRRQVLRDASLVCSSWRKRAQRRLFGRVELEDMAHVDDFLDALEGSPELGKLVTAVSVSSENDFALVESFGHALFPLTPDLLELNVCGTLVNTRRCLLGSSPPFIPLYCPLPAVLQSLTLNGLTVRDLEVLNHLPHLQDLVLIAPVFQRDVPFVAQHVAPLRSLAIYWHPESMPYLGANARDALRWVMTGPRATLHSVLLRNVSYAVAAAIGTVPDLAVRSLSLVRDKSTLANDDLEKDAIAALFGGLRDLRELRQLALHHAADQPLSPLLATLATHLVKLRTLRSLQIDPVAKAHVADAAALKELCDRRAVQMISTAAPLDRWQST